MRTRTVLAGALVAVVAAGGFSPSFAAPKPKPKPKPITGAYTAMAAPDPTSTSLGVGSNVCKPTSPAGKFSYTFKVPAAGTLEARSANMLDWSLALVEGGSQLSTSDGGGPQDKEAVSASFKKATTVVIDACNFAGEPQIKISFVFTYK